MENVKHVLITPTLMMLINDAYQMHALLRHKFFNRMAPVRCVKNIVMQTTTRHNVFQILALTK